MTKKTITRQDLEKAMRLHFQLAELADDMDETMRELVPPENPYWQKFEAVQRRSGTRAEKRQVQRWWAQVPSPSDLLARAARLVLDLVRYEAPTGARASTNTLQVAPEGSELSWFQDDRHLTLRPADGDAGAILTIVPAPDPAPARMWWVVDPDDAGSVLREIVLTPREAAGSFQTDLPRAPFSTRVRKIKSLETTPAAAPRLWLPVVGMD